MIHNILYSILFFLVLITESYDISPFVNAFAMERVIRCPNSFVSSLKSTGIKTTSNLSATKIESRLDEMKTSSTTVESISVATANDDGNKDTDTNSMINEAVTTKKVEGVDSGDDDLMGKIKESGVAGVMSYALWELAFWTVSVPVCVLGYKEVTGHWPDLQKTDDVSKLGAEAFAFVNFARFAVPLRIGLALSTTAWIQENIVDVYLAVDEKNIKKEMRKREDDVLRSTKDSDEEIGNDDDEDEISVVQSSVKGCQEEEITNAGGNRFRIRSRLRNLLSRVLRRKKRKQE
mmetsp:Transcript_24452/g.57503  ORF Transcript_24452/g.57503 Transcript_24452/m.57503 type:complete len:291 (-) Transcript_24452:85-957(-)